MEGAGAMSPEASAPYSDSFLYKSGLLRRATFTAIGMSGIPWMMRNTMQRRRATIILYHEIGPELFVEQVRALRRRYNIIPLRLLVDFLEGRAELPPRALVITFDDGHASNHLLLARIRELGVPVSVFLCSGIVGSGRRYWWSAVPSKEGIHRLQIMPNRERLTTLRDRYGFDELAEEGERAALSDAEVREMMGAVDFQSHTRMHPILTSCQDNEAQVEISGSMRELRDRFAIDAMALAYPDGYYGEREISMLRAAGYKCALTLDPGYVERGSDPYRLHRFCLSDDGGTAELLVKSSGLWAFARLLMSRVKGRNKLSE
jgi:peptidoglycan/xylan/chitin deacetylase (PgdA/CDA1 family)